MSSPPMGPLLRVPRLLFLSVLLCLGVAQAGSGVHSLNLSPGGSQDLGGVHFLGALELPRETSLGEPLWGISDLAWDADEGLLYLLTDGGMLHHLRPHFTQGRLTDVEFIASFRLRDQNGRPLHGFWRDAEGLDLRGQENGIHGDTQLLVSFERRLRVACYSPQGGLQATLPLPAGLGTLERYADPNHALEALTIHPRYGILIAPEFALPGEGKPGYVPIFDLQGHRWSYPHAQAFRSGVVALQALQDGSLLVLERAYFSPLHPVVISLRQITLPPAGGRATKLYEWMRLDSSRGWLVDNFEGLTHHLGRRFFMVSDNNRRAVQRNLLVYFELRGPTSTQVKAD